jgi:phage terminase large subunit-like protein
MPRGGEKFGAWFDHDAADAAAAFFPTYLRHTEAEWWGKPFHLEWWQENFVRTIFGWKRKDGTRLIRQAYLEVPRKNGKTEFAAGLAILVLVADGEFGGQAYSMAVNKDQARIVFDKASVMVNLSPELSDVITPYKTSLFCAELMSSFKPLSATPGAKHGFSPSFAIADELHEWPDGTLHDVVHKGTAARRQPLEVLITTAGQPGVSYGWELHELAEEVIKENVEDPTFFPMIFAAGPDDDWESPATWRKANPNFGVSVKEDYLASEVAKARGKSAKIGDFKRYHLNIWNDQVTGGLPMPQWDETPIRPVTLESLAGRPCWGGLDLSATTDLTALALISPALDGPGWDLWLRCWVPLAALEERMRRDRVDFQKWIDAGWIVGTEGDVTDYDVVRDTISRRQISDGGERRSPPLTEIVDLRQVALDRWNATQISSQLQGDGVNVVEFGQGYASMTAPTKEFDRLIRGHLLNHGGNPVLRWMAGCTILRTDGAENYKPVKPDRRASTKRIDGIVASIMALGVAMPSAAVATVEPEVHCW